MASSTSEARAAGDGANCLTVHLAVDAPLVGKASGNASTAEKFATLELVGAGF